MFVLSKQTRKLLPEVNTHVTYHIVSVFLKAAKLNAFRNAAKTNASHAAVSCAREDTAKGCQHHLIIPEGFTIECQLIGFLKPLSF